MVEPAPAPLPGPPEGLPPRTWRLRLLGWLARAKRPLLAVAAAGTVLSGLVGYWTTWRAVRGGTPQELAVAKPGGALTTVAVMPFANLGDDKADEHFADGVTDELIHLLTRVRGLRVAPRLSSFYFKDKSVAATEAARQLGVAYLVDGSVRRSGGRVRITAQLVAAADGRVVWSRSHDRVFEEVLAAQSEIAIGIAGSLMPAIDPELGLSGSGTANPRAWQAYLEARRLPAGTREAAYRSVLALDPKFARVHTALAEDVLASASSGRLPPRAVHDRMTKHLEEALRIDPRDDHAWGLMGAAAQLVDDVAALREVARRALETDRDSAAGSGWLAEVKLLEGDIGAALPLLRLMAERLPLVDWARNHHVQALRLANRPAEALEAAEQALALDPENAWAQGEKVRSMLALGRLDEALALARQRNMHTILIRYGTADDLAALQQRKDLDAHAQAWLRFAAGHPESVVEHLEAAHSSIQARNRVIFDPEYDPLRGLASFKTWLAAHGLTEAHERALAWRAANPVRRN
jgi:TolB-like protein/tetratricopeptide (TPR) repeat protein